MSELAEVLVFVSLVAMIVFVAYHVDELQNRIKALEDLVAMLKCDGGQR